MWILSTDRHKRRHLLVALLAASVVLLSGACRSEQEPVTVSLSQLVAEQESYEGTEVETRGTVRVFDEETAARHYVVEDARANRVQLVPESVAAGYVGREVVVSGQFGFDETSGRFIRIERIESAD